MPSLVLVKHSLPEIDPRVPANQWRLCEIGRQRCRPLADRLAGCGPRRIISSLEPKAIETAQIVARRLGLPAETAPDLHEHERHDVGVLSLEDFESSVRRFFERPGERVFGRETADQAHARFARALSGLIEWQTGENLVVVAHGTVITLFVARATGREPFALWKRLGLPSIVEMTWPELTLTTIVESVA